MNERLKYEGRLAEKGREARSLKLKLEGMVTFLRDRLDPTEDAGDLQGELIAAEALDFAALQGEYRAVMEDIKKIEKLLGVRS